jgi:hypothetical protein
MSTEGTSYRGILTHRGRADFWGGIIFEGPQGPALRYFAARDRERVEVFTVSLGEALEDADRYKWVDWRAVAEAANADVLQFLDQTRSLEPWDRAVVIEAVATHYGWLPLDPRPRVLEPAAAQRLWNMDRNAANVAWTTRPELASPGRFAVELRATPHGFLQLARQQPPRESGPIELGTPAEREERLIEVLSRAIEHEREARLMAEERERRQARLAEDARAQLERLEDRSAMQLDELDALRADRAAAQELAQRLAQQLRSIANIAEAYARTVPAGSEAGMAYAAIVDLARAEPVPAAPVGGDRLTTRVVELP